MALSIFTTTYNHLKRGEHYQQSMQCYSDLADEVIEINDKWPKEFSWEFIGQQFQKGYEACSGDWVIHADLDFIFHEEDYSVIKRALVDNEYAAVLSFVKYQFIQPDGYNVKSRLVIAVNKKRYGKRIRFDGGGDLCQPTLDGKEFHKSDVPETKIPIYNYECLLKTKAQLLEDKGRFARAWQRRFGVYKLGGPDDQSAYETWLKMVVGRYYRPRATIPLRQHPKIMQKVIKNLKPEQWGYDGFGAFEVNNYAKD